MAIGLGCLFGFRFPENFNFPYISRSITDFWRRWHISLSTWFRDYLYIPLGGNRVSKRRNTFNLLTVFFLCGLWHGAAWNFVIWGLFHGFFLVLEKSKWGEKLRNTPRLFQHVYTLFIVMVGWIFFRADSAREAWRMIRALVGFGSPGFSEETVRELLSNEVWVAFSIAVIASTPIFGWLRNRLRSSGRPSWVLADISGRMALAAIFAVCLAYLAAGTFNPFIYFRF
jgi:alginate O-acetyltransferase complex protein AlgI